MTTLRAGAGYAVRDADPAMLAWAQAAHTAAQNILAQDGERRHGGTWFVGVDALPNAADGSIAGVPLGGAWLDQITPPADWHRAQLSVIFPGYPQQDADESDSAHRYRLNRDAAHVDGLLPEGTNRRRHLREPHGFIAGIPLNNVAASPLVVWPGSHQIMQAAFARAFDGHDPSTWGDLDITDRYQAARRAVFETCERVLVKAKPGQVILLDRHLVHGVASWGEGDGQTPRMIAYFRPVISPQAWL